MFIRNEREYADAWFELDKLENALSEGITSQADELRMMELYDATADYDARQVWKGHVRDVEWM